MTSDMGKMEHCQIKYKIFEIYLILSKHAEYLQ